MIERAYTEKIHDTMKWYMYWQGQMKNAPLEQKVAFLEKCVRCMLQIECLSYEEINRVDEGRDKVQLLLPTGLTLHDDIREG